MHLCSHPNKILPLKDERFLSHKGEGGLFPRGRYNEHCRGRVVVISQMRFLCKSSTFDGVRGFRRDLPDQSAPVRFGPSSRICGVGALDNSDAAAQKPLPPSGEKLVNTNTKYSLKYNSAPIYLRGDITISYVKGQALRSDFASAVRVSFWLTEVRRTCSGNGASRAAEPGYPQGPGNNYEAQLKTREKLCPIFIIIHLSRIEFTLEFSPVQSPP